jgi:5-methyltetrahydrofolate--homocysteine methyltransferase
MGNVPTLQVPDDWQSRVPSGWEWADLWVAIEKGKHKVAHELVQKAIDTGIHPKVILDDGLFPGFNLQGERFSEQIIFIPEMLITARAMKAGLALIRPLLAAAAEKPVGTFVTIMLENAGFRVINLGTDTHPDKFINTARDEKADLVGFSALLSTTIYYQKVTIEEFVKAGLRSKVKILVGGAPTSQQWADEIGADGWGKDAMLAVQLAKRLVHEPREPWE